jgi:hypothetical protein
VSKETYYSVPPTQTAQRGEFCTVFSVRRDQRPKVIITIKIIIPIGTSWQRVVDMNPQVASGCQDVVIAGQV